MTCGESRFVFTVINALCNSLKTIKEAEVFPFYFFILLSTARGIMSYLLFMMFNYSEAYWDSCRYILPRVSTTEERVGKCMRGI